MAAIRRSYLLPVILAACAAAVLAALYLNPSPPAGATFPGANGKIAFERDLSGQRDIFVINEDGGGETNLTDNPANDFDPAWSPDGSKIAFVSERDGNREIYLMDADGANVTRLTDDPAPDLRPAWSPDGQTIAFRRGDEIWIMDSDGSNQVNLSQGHAVDTSPDFSPDGSKIAFASNEDGDFEIMVMDADGSNRVALTDNPGYDGDPSWSPDGTRIVFARSGASGTDIWVMNADGTGQEDLTNSVLDPDATPDWSPDGTKIAFAVDLLLGSSDVFVMDADGSGAHALTADHASFNPDWQVGPPSVSDVNCDGSVDAVDALAVLRHTAGLAVAQPPECAALDTGNPLFGDVNCSGIVDAVDALAILRFAAGLPVDQPPDCPPIGPAGSPGPSPAPSSSGTPAPSPTPEPAHLTLRNTGWHVDSGGVLVAAGEIVNESDRPVGLVRVEASIYGPGGELLKTGAGYSCLMTLPAGGQSPFEVQVLSPAGSVDRVELEVAQFFDPPFVPAPEGLQAQVSNTYTDFVGYFHAAGTITNASGANYKLVKACLAFYDANGAVFRSKFAYASPNVLGPGQSASFDASLKPEGATLGTVGVWPDAMAQ